MCNLCLGLPSGLQPTWRDRGPGEPRNPTLGSCGPPTPQTASGHSRGQAGPAQNTGGWTSLLKPAPLSSHQARRVRTGRGSPATSGMSTETLETHLEIILPRAARLLSSGHTAGAAVLLRPQANQPVGQDAAEEQGGALKGALGGSDERVLPGGGEVSAGLHTSNTQIYPGHVAPQSCALKAGGDGGKTGRRRGRVSQVPGPRRVSVCCQQRQEGLLVGTGVPQPFPGVLGLRGVLSGTKMLPRRAAPTASAHVPPTAFMAGRPSLGRRWSLALSSPGQEDPAPQPHLAARSWGNAPAL